MYYLCAIVGIVPVHLYNYPTHDTLNSSCVHVMNDCMNDVHATREEKLTVCGSRPTLIVAPLVVCVLVVLSSVLIAHIRFTLCGRMCSEQILKTGTTVQMLLDSSNQCYCRTIERSTNATKKVFL